MVPIPRVVYSAWLQGAARAPAMVQLCLARWAELNPGHQIQVLDAQATAALLAPYNIPPVPAQALSDMVRVKLLLDHGGIWVDASLFPVLPLDAWLPRLVAGAGFFAFARPGPDRPISSWLMAAAPGHPIIRRLWAEILRFWQHPRKLAHYAGGLLPPCPAASVAPGASDTYPYFWLHYLFQYLLETDTEFAAHWARCPQISAGPPHQLQALCASSATPEAIMAAARSAPVQKLNWRAQYPLDVLARV